MGQRHRGYARLQPITLGFSYIVNSSLSNPYSNKDLVFLITINHLPNKNQSNTESIFNLINPILIRNIIRNQF